MTVTAEEVAAAREAVTGTAEWTAEYYAKVEPRYVGGARIVSALRYSHSASPAGRVRRLTAGCVVLCDVGVPVVDQADGQLPEY